MKQNFDVIVAGVGGMGSATCYQLAKRGAKVLGLEQFTVGHALGSSHGETRLIRQAYFEAAAYVPLLKRSYDLWDELELEASRSLLQRVGLLIMGPQKGGNILPGVLRSAVEHGIELEILKEQALKKRFPQFTPPDGYQGFFEPGAGYLEVEKCVTEYARLARERGAEIRENENVLNWDDRQSEIVVKTDKGEYFAKQLVITAGPWAAQLLRSLGVSLTVRRVVQFWFSASPQYDLTSGSPCFGFDGPETFLYGFPQLPTSGLKIADHEPGDAVADPAKVDRHVYPKDAARFLKYVPQFLPGVLPNPVKHSVCMYTMTKDDNFIVDKHPEHDNVFFAAGFSGHGFKFASVIGEILADLTLTGATAHPIQFLRLRPAVY